MDALTSFLSARDKSRRMACGRPGDFRLGSPFLEDQSPPLIREAEDGFGITYRKALAICSFGLTFFVSKQESVIITTVELVWAAPAEFFTFNPSH